MTSNIQDQGYWVVNNQIFYNKYKAMLYATQIGKEAKDVTFNFHDAHFDQFNWTEPSNKSLDQLYADHARRLRQKYDYLVLHYSGGPDSHNILDTFARNKILLDEIVIRGSNFDNINVNEIKVENLDAECIVKALPLAKFYKETYFPHLKINFIDIRDQVIDWWKNTKNVADLGHFVSDPNQIIRYDNMKLLGVDPEKYKGRKVGHIFGHDKPIMQVDEIGYYFLFNDECSFKYFKHHGLVDRADYNVEFFYWNKDNAELIINQCHKILHTVLSTGKNDYWENHITDGFRWRKHQDYTASIIYNRQYDIDYFMLKPPHSFIYSNGWWFEKDKSSSYYKNYAKHFWEWKKALHPSFLYSGDITRHHTKKRYLIYFDTT